MYIFSVYFCVFFKIILVNSSLAPTHLFVTRVGPCYDTPKTILSISEMSINRKIYDFSLSGQIAISEDIPNGWTVRATMQKCPDLRNLDTCDYFKSFTVVKNGCIEKENSEDIDLYNMLFHYTHPRLTCPIKSGNYSLVSYPFFTEDNYLSVSESKLSTSVFGYTFRLEGFNDDNKIMCVDAYLQLLYIREHDWVDNDEDEDATTAAAPYASSDDDADK